MIRSTIAALLLGALQVNADFCSKGSAEINGNWYCQPVKHIKYSGVGHSGSYNVITGMSESGSCTSSSRAFSGSLAPFDQDLSVHFRGPLTLKQFAVYQPSGKSKREAEAEVGTHRHHRHRRHHHRHQARALGDPVTATINGQVVTWANNYDGTQPTPAAANNNVAPVANNAKSQPNSPPVQKAKAKENDSKPSPSYTSASPAATSKAPSGGDWSRSAYFNMDSQSSDGIVFMNNMGGQGSGVFDYVYGNSLSYAASAKNAGASSAEVLSQALKSNQEVALFSNKKCDEGCDYYRKGIPAYYGWGGDAKIFAFEFDMPDDGTSGWNMNMPAIWLLNARIPRTGQYVKSDCSCWTTGCGELDLFEVLDSGNNRAKSTIHAKQGGGCSDYFERPTSGTIKLVAVLYNDEVNIKVVDDFDFGSGIGSDTVNSWTKESSDTSVFNM